jgi:uncharacterized membrane protein
MKQFFLLLTLTTVIVFAACSKKANPAKTTASEAPKVKSVTYNADVMPLLQAKCSPCHIPSKGGNKANFENYESAKKYAVEILPRIQLNPGDRGFMPMRNPKLPEDEIAKLKQWIDQGLLEK